MAENKQTSDDSKNKMKELIQQRGSIKGRLTVFQKYVESVRKINSKDIDSVIIGELQLKLTRIQELLINFDEIQNKIECLVSDIDDQIQERDLIETGFCKAISVAQNIIETFDKSQKTELANNGLGSCHGSASCSNHHHHQLNVKLPTINLPTFDGNHLKWLEFRDTFESLIHNNESLSAISKFHYLRNSLEGGASVVIKSISFTSSNYELAWSTLCDRFNNKRILINNHTKALFNFEPISKESYKSIRYMVDYYSKNLRALEDLGEPVQYWYTMIIYIMASKLDVSTSRKWEEHRNTLELSPKLVDFFEFLRGRADVLETMQYSRFDSGKSEKNNTKDAGKSTKSFIVNNNSNNKNCLICKQNHFLYMCDKFKAMTLSDRSSFVNKHKLCVNCLRAGHHVSQCRLGPCKTCKKRHNSLLHKNSDNDNNNTSNLPVSQNDDPLSAQASSVALSAMVPNQVLLCTAEVGLVDVRNNRTFSAKALLDSGSQSSFITEKAQKTLNISCSRANPISVCGINNTITNVVKVCDLVVRSRTNDFFINVNCLVIPHITSNLPNTPVDVSKLNLPPNILLADTKFFQPSEIHILLGADVFWEIVNSKQIKLGPSQPILQESKFGWLIAGPIGFMSNLGSNIKCNFSQEIRDSLAKFWELEELPQVSKLLSKEEEKCEAHFVQNYSRLPNGRFCVKLPLRENPEEVLGDTYKVVKNQFYSLEKRLTKQNIRQDYSNFLKEYEQLGHLIEVSRPPFGYYIPHHAVLRESSETTKLRVVFNASFKTSGKSLNEIMLVGPTIQDDLFSILLRFRQNIYVVTGDIEKMYRQIEVDKSQRHLQLILWRSDESEQLRILQLNTVTYGTASAPFLSTRCLIQLANECSDDKIANVIRHDFYVDDLNTGSHSKTELKFIIKNVIAKLNEGCFPLRKFRTNVPEIFDGIPIDNQTQEFCKDSTVLGLNWSPTNDLLQFSTNIKNSSVATKRNILASSSKLFDPLGLMSACTITPKIILQQLWSLKSGWDDPIPDNIKALWESFINDFEYLSTIQIPRCVLSSHSPNIEIHCFTDASQKAYAACIYIKSNNEVRLLCAKAKVAPLKPGTTIPRLELLGALLGARLYSKVVNSLRVSVIKSVFWSDSTIVLGWLKTQPKVLKQFVCNRIQEIRQLTDPLLWRHIPTELNPADLASRGILPQQLQKSSLWWRGPSFLLEAEECWPRSSPTSIELPEIKISLKLQRLENIVPFEKYSKFSKLQRVIAFVLRFIRNCKSKTNKFKGILTSDELHQSLLTLVKQSQNDSFPEDIHSLSNTESIHSKSRLLSLNPFLDENGILRVGGRIQNASHCTYNKIHPIVIDAKHIFTKLLFEREHVRLLHCGPQQLLSSIHQQYWPIGGRALSSSTVFKCMKCKRFKAQGFQPLMGNLPSSRVNIAPPFETCGTDFAGPFLISNRKGRGSRTTKCYLCIFVCLFTKAVHLEVVSDLTTNAFILCLRRFIARRGKPKIIYCDNGKNFVGASNELARLVKRCEQSIGDYASGENVEFKFSPPYSPNFGGIYEAGVKSAKYHLKRIAGNTSLTFEELSTLFAQIEAILNSRPLTCLSTDPSDLTPLTPGHFLIGRPLTALPSPVSEPITVNRYRLLERLRNQFWKRWTHEVLSTMQQRVKWRTKGQKIKIGDLVLVKDDSLPPLQWLMGRVTQLHPGQDGITRVVDIITKKGRLRRAISRLCPMLHDQEPIERRAFNEGEKC